MGVGVGVLLTTSACLGQPPTAVPGLGAPRLPGSPLGVFRSAEGPCRNASSPSAFPGHLGSRLSARLSALPPSRALSCVTRFPFQYTVTSSC